MQNTHTLNSVRDIFLSHMKDNETYPHVIVPSAPIIPENDPTTLFTGSGMQPMVPYLLGEAHPMGMRIADSQKCFRSQDIEEVGDNRHTTFFEMLGNWSLGDYFKDEQIDMMWDFLVHKINMDPRRLYMSVYRGNESLAISRDEVAIAKWQEKFREYGATHDVSEFSDVQVGMNPEEEGMVVGQRIFAYNDEKNWWSRSGIPANMPVGEPGGPDTEMFYDFDPLSNPSDITSHILNIHANSVYKNEVCHINCDCGRFVEFGNNVFMQYKKTQQGVEELTQKNVDFGGGLERIVATLSNDADIFNIDVFAKAKEVLENISNTKYVSDLAVTFTDTLSPTFAYRVILDHIRAATFLIGDGVLPGSKDQNYFVRRLIRRAVRYARNLNIHDNFTKQVAQTFVNYYADVYTNLKENEDKILEELDKEETKFRKTLENGMKKLNKIIDSVSVSTVTDPSQVVSSKVLFDLYQNDGFPFELSIEELKNSTVLKNFILHFSDFYTKIEEGFEQLKNAHAESSRSASAGKFKGGLGDDSELTTELHSATHLLLAGLKKVLGSEIHQAGSNITTERLRFDFNFDRKIEEGEVSDIEKYVNTAIVQGFEVDTRDMEKSVAKSEGVEGSFWDKYPEIVKVWTMKNVATGEVYSKELCGGPHVKSSDMFKKEDGTFKVFKISKQESVSQGVRRIKATLE